MSLKLGIKSYIAKNETVKRDWYVVDATDVVLGRLASEVATRLRGKHKPEFTPNVDTGDHIIIINAEKIKVTGDKLRQKIYYRHSNYPGGLKSTALRKQLEDHPERALEIAIKGMLPKGPLGYAMYTKLRVYKGAEHGHQAQQPKTLTL